MCAGGVNVQGNCVELWSEAKLKWRVMCELFFVVHACVCLRINTKVVNNIRSIIMSITNANLNVPYQRQISCSRDLRPSALRPLATMLSPIPGTSSPTLPSTPPSPTAVKPHCPAWETRRTSVRLRLIGKCTFLSCLRSVVMLGMRCRVSYLHVLFKDFSFRLSLLLFSSSHEHPPLAT